MKILKRTISALLALVMVFTMLPMNALATETEPVTVPEETAPVGDGALDGPLTTETEVVETVPETTTPEVFVEETAELVGADATASGTCGENLTWELVNGVLTICGIGGMNAHPEELSWKRYSKVVTELVIGEGITSISSEAFANFINLTKVKLPESLTMISYYAFGNCSKLPTIFIPRNVSYIAEYVFFGCDSLDGIWIDENNQAYCSDEFGVLYLKDKSKLIQAPATLSGSYVVPASVSYLLDSAFCKCYKLEKVTLPKSIRFLLDFTFLECSALKEIIWPGSITSVGEGVFADCSSLSDVYYSGTYQQWAEISIGADNEALQNATIHYNSTGPGTDDMLTELTGWQRAYYNFIISDKQSGQVDKIYNDNFSDDEWSDVVRYELIYVDNNNIPEIWISYPFGGTIHSPNRLLSYADGKILNEFTGNTSIQYEERKNRLNLQQYLSGSISDNIYELNNGTLKKLAYGSETWIIDGKPMGESIYEWDGVSVTKEQYNENLSYWIKPSDTDSVVCNYEEILDYLLNYKESNYHFVISPETDTLTAKTGQPLEIIVYLYHGDALVTDLVLPDLALGHLGGEKILNYIGWEPTGDGGYVLKLKGAAPGVENLTIYDETTDTKLDFSVTVTKAEVNEYLDNSEIKINDSGSAFAYYIGDPEQDFLLTVNEKKQSVHSNEKGVFRVSLGTFAADGKENVTVKVTHIGGGELPEPLVFHSCITVTPLEFSQSWEASMDASLGAKLMAGAEFKPFKLKASLGEVGGKIGGGTAMNISRSYSAEGETLELTSDKKVQAGLTVKCGITGQALAGKFESGASLNVGGSDTITYGLKIKDYSPDNSAQQKAVATYLLGEALFSCPGNVIVKNFYDHMAESVYQNASGTIVHGSASKLSGSFGGGIATATINGVEIASVLESEVSAAIVQAEKTASDGSQEKSMSANLDMNLSAVTPAKRVEGSEIGVNSSVLSADFLGADIKVAAKQSEKEKTLEASSLSASAVEMNIIEVGVPSTAVYSKYIFKDEAMDGLLSSTKHFDDYVNRNLFALSLSDLCELADVLSTSDAPIEYKSETKDKYAISLPLEFGLGLGSDIDFGVTLSYLADTSYTNATGYAVEDSILLTSESGDLSSQVKANKRDLVEIFTNCIQSLANDAANFFKKIGNTIQQGVEDAWGWIEEKADSVKDWFVSLTCVSTEEAWGESTEIGVLGSYVNFALARQSVNPNEAYVTRTAMTIGRPFVVSVTDNTTGEAVTDFSEEPLEFTLRYAGEDLMAADYDVETQEIAMYRYSDDGDYFEHIGGLHDADAMTVTAIITKPGQYILAAEEIAEKGCGYALGDVNHDAKINAKDATLILQSSVGVLKPTASFCETCAEVSGDGKLNAKDSTMILQYSVGARTEFPGQK